MNDGIWEESSEASEQRSPPTGKIRRHLHLWVAVGLGLIVLLGFAAQNLIGRVRAASQPASTDTATAMVLGQAPALAPLQQELAHEQITQALPLPEPPPEKTSDADQQQRTDAAAATARLQAQIAASPILALTHLPTQSVPLATNSEDNASPPPTIPSSTNGLGAASLGSGFNTPFNLSNISASPWNPSPLPGIPSPPTAPPQPSARSHHNTSPLEAHVPSSPIPVFEGTVINAVLITQINSDLPGLITAQVTEDVYDSLQGNMLVIPKGSRVIGSFAAHILAGQERLMASFHRLILPSGVSYDLDETVASDAIGQAGMQDEVDNRFWKRLGGQFMTAGLASIIQQPNGGVTVLGGMGNNLTTDAAGQILVNTASIGFAADAAIGPVIIIKKGYPFTLLVNRDMDFAKPPH